VSARTAGAAQAWELAASEATAGGHPVIENALLLVGILSLETIEEAPAHLALAPDVRHAVEDEARRVAEVVARCGLQAASLRRLLRDLAGRGGGDHHREAVSRSPACRETFYRAAMLSGPAGVSALDLMAALGEAPDAVVARALREGGASVERLREEARRSEREWRAAARPPAEAPGQAADPALPCLEGYGRDLTALAARGALGPVIGRRGELLQVLQILARAGRNNPVLVGEPGVGKTAIVEALAIRAAQGKDPAVLGGKRIVELRGSALLAATHDRGTLEERVARVLAETKGRPEVIVFVDELHTVLGAGETEGRVADLLEAALGRGELRLIGATTNQEYRKHVESDPARERHFEKVAVGEPSREETLEILTGLRPCLEGRHGVAIDDDALLAAVELSARFDPDHNLPAKAIELVETAAARARGPTPSTVGAPDRVTERAVAQVLAEKARLPLEVLAEGRGGLPRPRVLDLEPFLRERILGQERAIERVGRRLRLALAETRDPERPLATLLFLGPGGVGKSETARLAASFLFGTEKALHRLDTSELVAEQLVSRLRTIPHALVLLDDMEKAPPRALDLLRQVFDEGRLTDGNGRMADARHAIFVLTSTSDLPPELLSRIDEVIAFRALGPEDAVRIVRLRLRLLCETVERQHGARLEVEPEAEEFIARSGFDPARGVRDLRRAVERLVEAPLSSLILDGKIRKHADWRVAYDEGGIYVVPRA
jgi:ATP-dependent Clp protease ATP-binding subunit ClpC